MVDWVVAYVIVVYGLIMKRISVENNLKIEIKVKIFSVIVISHMGRLIMINSLYLLCRYGSCHVGSFNVIIPFASSTSLTFVRHIYKPISL